MRLSFLGLPLSGLLLLHPPQVTLLEEYDTPRERVRRALRKKARDESMHQAGELAPAATSFRSTVGKVRRVLLSRLVVVQPRWVG